MTKFRLSWLANNTVEIRKYRPKSHNHYTMKHHAYQCKWTSSKWLRSFHAFKYEWFGFKEFNDLL